MVVSMEGEESKGRVGKRRNRVNDTMWLYRQAYNIRGMYTALQFYNSRVRGVRITCRCKRPDKVKQNRE